MKKILYLIRVPFGAKIKYINQEVREMSKKDTERLFRLFELGRITMEQLLKYLGK